MGSTSSVVSGDVDADYQWDGNSGFPQLGVKISHVDDFFEVCGGRDKLEGLTTKEVCEQFIKPMTEHHECSYCDLLRLSNNPGVGVATVFVSHAWKYQFLNVVSALQLHLREESDKIVWFDLFSNNQHKASVLPYEWWSSTFKSAIQKFGHTIMVLSPWNNPIPYTRAWCIFEAYCTSITNSKFEIAMGSHDRDQFVNDILIHPQGSINEMLATIRAEKSECYMKEDRERIFTTIGELIGFPKINAMVFEQYRQWVIDVTLTTLQHSQDPNQRLQLLNAIGELYKGQGKHNNGEPYLKRSLVAHEALFGERHAKTIAASITLADLYWKNGIFSKAEQLLDNCLDVLTQDCSLTNSLRLLTLFNLASVHDEQGRHSEALAFSQECYELSKSIENKEGIIRSLHQLSVINSKLENIDMAQKLCEECLQERVDMLGEMHPYTLKSLNHLAVILLDKGDLKGARIKCMDCLEKRKTVLGEDNPDTVWTVHVLAQICEKLEYFDEAKHHYEISLQLARCNFGDDHPDAKLYKKNLEQYINAHS